MILKKFLSIALPLCLVSFTLISCSDTDEAKAQRDAGNSVIPSVEAVEARYGSLPLVERFSGNVKAENQVPIFPEISGRVEEVYVENGETVSKGQPLVKLNDDQFQQQLEQARAGLRINEARVRQAKANLSQIQAQYDRIKQLAEKDLSSDLELEQVQAQLETAKADLELAEAQRDQSLSLVEERQEQLSRTVIKAPISGTLGQRNAEVGMQVTPSSQLYLIGDLDNLRIEIVLTERMLNRIQLGQTANIAVENKQGEIENITAKVTRISPFLNETTRSTEAEIDVNNERGLLKPGMFVPVDINFGESEKATLIPVSALFTDPATGEEGIFVAPALGTEIQPVSDSSAGDSNAPAAFTSPTEVQFKPIEVLARGRMEVGVTGLESGQWVVTIGQDLLAEGRSQARIRTISWDRILRLQQLQSEDLLREVLQQQNENNDSVTL